VFVVTIFQIKSEVGAIVNFPADRRRNKKALNLGVKITKAVFSAVQGIQAIEDLAILSQGPGEINAGFN